MEKKKKRKSIGKTRKDEESIKSHICMVSGFFNSPTDLYDIHHVIMNNMIRFPKDLVISSLKDFFSRDSKYHYSQDDWGYPNTQNVTNMPITAGVLDDLVTRVFIGEANRFATIHYPAILVKAGSFRYVPISMNRDQYNIEYESIEFYDDDNNRKWINMPDKFVSTGAWEGNLSIEVQSRGIRERDDLIELVSLYLIDINWNNMSRAGVSIKPTLSVGAPFDSEDRNDKLHKQSISIDIRGEWRKETPISDVIDLITFCVQFADPSDNIAPNIQINTEVALEDEITSESDIL